MVFAIGSVGIVTVLPNGFAAEINCVAGVVCKGTAGDDRITGTPGPDVIDSYTGNDYDKDGLSNEIETKLLTDPTNKDTDNDTIADNIEISNLCLNALNDDSQVMDMKGDIINSTGIDSDNDGTTNVIEVKAKQDPCT